MDTFKVGDKAVYPAHGVAEVVGAEGHLHFTGQIGEGEFDLEDVCDRLADKLIRRHPHVFGTTEVSGSEEVLVNWDVIKQQEKADKGDGGDRNGIPAASALAGVVMTQSALVVSEKLQAKAAKVRFDWKDPVRVLAKLQEEVGELGEALADNLGPEALVHELGDVMTATVNLARQLKLDPEAALREANRRFIRRFTEIERLAGGSIDGLELARMEELWQEAKRTVG
jgi:tetrapyrrole methylase family protein/MazG family protein